MEEQFDLVVIGGGPGGYGAALYATSAGLNVAVVEKDSLGGTCLNRGCIPAKAYLESAAVNRHVAHAADFGIESSAPVVNFGAIQARKQKIVDGIVKSLGGFMKSKKITILDGVGSLGPNRTVTVQHPDGSTSTLTGRHVLLAAGSVPRTIPGFEPNGPVMTSDEVLMLQSLPARVAVIGGGAIGCEFASTFADLGSQVTILEGLPKILPGLDADVANVVVRSFKKKQIDIKTDAKVLGHTPTGRGGTVVQYTASAVVLWVGAVVHERIDFTVTARSMFALAWAVIVLSIAAVLIMLWLLQHHAAAKVSSLFFLTPALSTIEGAILFDETLGALAVVGLVAALVGVSLTLRTPVVPPSD